MRKAVATFRFVWNWAHRRGHVPTKFPEVELVFPKEKQPEPFRTYDQIQAILARGGIDKRRERELWDGLFLDPAQVAEVLEHVRRKPNTSYLHPFLVTAAYTGARRANCSARGSRTSTSTRSSSSSGRRSGAGTRRRSAPWT